MKIVYCLPIIKGSTDEIDAIIETQKDSYQYFEIWLDYIDSLKEEWVDKKIKELGGRLILLFRRKNLEPVQMSSEQRQSIMKMLDGSETLLDLDVNAQKSDIEFLKSNKLNIPIIISYHNYERTPEKEELDTVVAAILAERPNIAKIAAYCNSNEDALRLMDILLDMQSKHQKSIVLGMGPNGVLTRIFGTLWGNEMIFAPQTTNAQSAPGQLTRKQLKDIFTILNH